VKAFSSRVIAWQHQHGRHGLPWQTNRDPYRIWVSEVMLQQTQVVTVIPYFLRFMARFPDVNTLANASEDSVLELWSGLGYYSRARNLHKAAQQVVEHHAGVFPHATAFLESLPGIGRSTASAIAALAFGQTQAILDGNVKRVLARHAGVSGWPSDKTIENKLWALAESRLPEDSIEAYTQGMMDLGASLCTRTRPNCDLCPIADDCVGLKQGRLAHLPTPKPKKILPERQVQMLILMDHDQILLEKRPSRGIWGGLLSFPEIAPEIDALQYCQHQLGFTVQTSDSLPMLRHTFTHFRLSISPQIVQIAARPTTTGLTQHRWLSKSDVLKAAVPSPVRCLLLQL
jgi:A/G-specific adenine glycosylase